MPTSSEERLYDIFCERGIPPQYQELDTAGPHADMIDEATTGWSYHKPNWQRCFGQGLVQAVSSAVEVAAGRIPTLGSSTSDQSPAQRARSWSISSYPLLGALATTFIVFEDSLLCQRMEIAVAAVNVESKEIYFNPSAGLTEAEYRFVMAHALLHIGMRHDARRQGRDPYLWNVACDYVINSWLLEMCVGHLPQRGGLYDPDLKGESAEAIYDRMVTDMRRFRKLATLRGKGLSDILEKGKPDWWSVGTGVDLDEFYRRCMSQGLLYHQEQGRSLIPAGLEEEIRALSQPPIPWDVDLERWFDRHFPPPEKVHSYARPSRRQSATPDIPRPRWVPAPDWEDGCTFGVLLDTSGSMDRSRPWERLPATASLVMFLPHALFSATLLPTIRVTCHPMPLPAKCECAGVAARSYNRVSIYSSAPKTSPKRVHC